MTLDGPLATEGGSLCYVAGMQGQDAIVVEGGAMRGVFSAGVLDVFHEEGFHPFGLAIGVSAGACNLASHLAGQHGRNRRSYFELMTQRAFLDPRRLVQRRSMLDLDWLWDTLAEREPLDVQAALAHPTRLLVVATNGETGRPVYCAPTPDNLFEVLKGSCALPVLYRRPVHVEGRRLFDGGVTDPIPVREAYRRGARRMLVIRSRPAAAVKTTGLGTHASAWLMRREPAMARAVRKTAARYGEAVRFMNAPPADCRVIQVAPPAPLATGRTSQDRAGLERDYELGRRCGLDAIARYHNLSSGLANAASVA